MGLQSTLFTGVSGLQANGTRLSVIGNNIANVNTIGFKVGRANFNEFLVQRIDAAKRPLEGVRGGKNPMEYGLGVGLSSIDNLFSQGTLESTGVTTDLAIEGDGFFVVRQGQRRLYTRAGAFQFDNDGRLIQNSTGFIVQGRMANTAGVIASGSPIEDVIVPLGLTTPAKYSSRVVFKDNLNADSEVLSNVLTSGDRFSIRETGGPASGVTDINDLAQTINTLDEGDRIKISGTNPDGTVVTGMFRYGTGEELLSDGSTVARDGTTLGNLVNVINNTFSGVSATITAEGAVQLIDDSAGASQTSISLSFEEDAAKASVLGQPVQDTFLPESISTITAGNPMNIQPYDPDTGTGGFRFNADLEGIQYPRQFTLAVGGVDNSRANVITIAQDPNGDGVYETIDEVVDAINQGISADLELSGTVTAAATADGEIRFNTNSPSDSLTIGEVPNSDITTVTDLGFSDGDQGTGVGLGGLNLTSLKANSEIRIELQGDTARTLSITPRVYSTVEDLVNGLNAAINSNTALSGRLTAFVDYSQGAAAVSFVTTSPEAKLTITRGTQTVPLGGVDLFDALGFDDLTELRNDVIPGNEDDYNNISVDGNANSSIALAAFNRTQEGRDAAAHIASISVYDSFGETHNMNMTFTKSTQQLAAEINKLISTDSPLMIESTDPNAAPGTVQAVDASTVETSLIDLWSVDYTDPQNPVRGDAQPRAGDTIRITGTSPLGTVLATTLTIQGDPDPTTVEDLLNTINQLYSSRALGGDGTGATATINDNGQIVLTDDTAGASLSSMKIAYVEDPDNPRETLPEQPYGLAENFRTLQNGTNEITTDVPGQWDWEIRTTGNEKSFTGNDGTITFNPDGSLQGYTIQDRSNSFGFDPNNGSDRMEIQLDLGTIGGFDGLTMFQGPSTAIISSQDGFAAGKLSSIEIDHSGTMTGIFSNGVSKKLAQMVLGSFNNPSGLTKEGNNNYSESANSGVAVIGEAGTNIQGSISSGFLESSNVDLAQEFANIITTQRGFQANARVITSTDTLLNEVVNLAR
ncbi:MAG: flagellar hook-basal body complex protein [Candidatus Glassbacteria bacterium]|nr:flagellar hook-basal body complex protein [Candidatus Glassbacteria bacterium]